VSKAEEELPIFVRTYDFLTWLTPMTNHFPRAHRRTVTQRLLDAALNFLERLVEANQLRGSERLAYLRMADAELDKVRFYLRMAHRWQWLSTGQYEHGSRMLAEMGRLLGGWQKVSSGSRAGNSQART
jgi:four helix bundle protein